MDIWGAILVLARRFYITLPLAGLTLFGAYFMTRSIAPEYHAGASVVLIGPTIPSDKDNPAPVNPYTGMGAKTLTTTLQIDLTGPTSLQQLQAAHNSTNFTLVNISQTSILSLTATSDSAQQAVSTANQLVTMLQSDLANRQQTYTSNPGYQVTAKIIAPAAIATADTGARTKAAAIAIGGALLLTIIVVLIIDSVLASRARRRLVLRDNKVRTSEPESAPQHTVVRS